MVKEMKAFEKLVQKAMKAQEAKNPKKQ
jgi:hypothetical protein